MTGRFGPLTAFAVGCALITTTTARADDIKLPTTMAFTAYDTGTAGFNIAVAVGKMMKDKHGTDV
ncbi:C4-dicarboxylate ABC transporter, partial [Rhodopseudomonas sp. BR0C11]|nr:C4-dicarboxylate ABC transporter [Rhodopseudomonas sp. BR0C11]